MAHPSTFDALRADAVLKLLPGLNWLRARSSEAEVTAVWDRVMGISQRQTAPTGMRLDGLLSEIRGLGIAVPDTALVVGYLASRAPVASKLLEACRLARANFGSDSYLSLEVDKDPESGACTLAIFIRQRAYGTGFVSKVQAVAEEVEALFPSTAEWILVTSDFAPPST